MTTTRKPILCAICDEPYYATTLDDFDSLVLSEPGTPPGCRFDELMQLIEYAARRSGRVLPQCGIAGATSPIGIDGRRKAAKAANR